MLVLNRRLLLVAVAVLLAGLVGLGARLVINQTTERGGPHRVNSYATWKFHFDTSAEMLATADLVVEGKVTGVGRGRILPGNSEVRQQLKEFRITATRVWKGAVAPGPFVVEDAGWAISTAPGEGEMELVIADMIQPAPGDHGVFFLSRNRSDGRLSFINNQGLYLVSGDQVRDTSRSNPLVDSLERLSESGLHQQLRSDLRLVKAGLVLPRRPA